MGIREDELFSELKKLHAVLAVPRTGRLRSRHRSVCNAIDKLVAILARPMRIAVLGEQNSGKSLLINYLLKHQILPSGSFSGESTELLIRYASEPSVNAVSADGSHIRLTSKAFGRLVKPEMRNTSITSGVIYDAWHPDKRQSALLGSASGLVLETRKKPLPPPRLIEVGLPLGFLKRIELVEVRAFPDGKATSPSRRVFRGVDSTIWCTLATQAWKETEILTLKSVPAAHRKSSLMLVTYKDAIRSAKDEAKILARLRHSTKSLFNDVVLVSLRDAVQSLLDRDKETAERFRSGSNIEGAENALIAMMMEWRIRRLHKASRIIHRAAVTVASSAYGRDMARAREIAVRLDRLATEFLKVSPRISLSNRAA